MNYAQRAAYMDASVATANPARLLVMLYERLVLDVQRGRDALESDDRATAREQLLHAQDIVAELSSSLKPDLWSGGPAMASLYDYLYQRLVHANIHADVAAATECLGLVSELSDTWRQAALESMAATA